MKNCRKKIDFILMILLCGLFFTGTPAIYAQTATPTETSIPTPSTSETPTPTDSSQSKQDLQNQINDLEGKVSNLQSQAQTLSSQIDVMNNTITLTQDRIQATEQQIAGLKHDIAVSNTEISKLNSSVDGLTKSLLAQIVATYENGNLQDVTLLATANKLNSYVTQQSYLKIVQEHNKKLLYDLDTAKNDYATQKQYFANKQTQMEALQTQLQGYTDQLATQKADKQTLLTQTQGSEANYERILAQTKAQLASFSGFVSSQGGDSLLSGQTVCDSWGCYYNQRDSQWGGNALNGTGYSLASSGCLITSMAMVYTHYGHRDVTPQSINSVSSNFSGIPAALLRTSISANGISSQRVGASIDSVLSGGDPVIVGISYDGGPYPDHFVVLISGSGGNYVMNDPYTANGNEIPFTSKYSLGSIVEVDRVTM